MKKKLRLALNEIKNGKMNMALQILSEIISSGVKNFDVYLYRGKVKRVLNDFQGALEDYNTAALLFPERAEVFNNRSKLFYLMSLFDRALSDIKKANKLYPENPLILFNKGVIESKLNLYGDALASYNKTLILNPEFLPAYIKRGLLKEKTGDYSGAMNDYIFANNMNRKCAIANYYMDRLSAKQFNAELTRKKSMNFSGKFSINKEEMQNVPA